MEKRRRDITLDFLSKGKLPFRSTKQSLHLHQFRKLFQVPPKTFLGNLVECLEQSVGLHHRHIPPEDRTITKYHPNLLINFHPGFRRLHSIHKNLSLCRCQNARKHLNSGGFSTSVRAYIADGLSFCNLKVYIVYRPKSFIVWMKHGRQRLYHRTRIPFSFIFLYKMTDFYLHIFFLPLRSCTIISLEPHSPEY